MQKSQYQYYHAKYEERVSYQEIWGDRFCQIKALKNCTYLLVVITKLSMPPLLNVMLGNILISLSSLSPVRIILTLDLHVASLWDPVRTVIKRKNINQVSAKYLVQLIFTQYLIYICVSHLIVRKRFASHVLQVSLIQNDIYFLLKKLLT